MSGSRVPNSTWARGIATFEKQSKDLIETNPDGNKRSIYFRERPIHALAAFTPTRAISQRSEFAHWGIQVGNYMWELAVLEDAVTCHVGFWKLPEKEGIQRYLTAAADGEAFDPLTMDPMTERGEEVGKTCMTDHDILSQAHQVMDEMNGGSGGSRLDRLLQFYSVTHPMRNFKRLSSSWREKHRYDEVMNNCQHFVKRLAEKLDPETSMREAKTIQERGRLLRMAVHNAQQAP